MPNALTNTNISATYKGVLHANGEPIPDIGLKPVYDGTGVQSALSLGRTNEGASVSGLFSANDVQAGELRMPNADGLQNQVVARIGAGTLGLRSISELIGSGPQITNGVYDNPRITVEGNVITKIESRPTIKLLTTSDPIIPFSSNKINGGPSIVVNKNTNINWTEKLGYNDIPGIKPRYAIITVELFGESENLFFEGRLTKDSTNIGYIVTSANYVGDDREEYLSSSKNNYLNQMIVSIPENEISLFSFIATIQARTYNGPGANNRANNVGYGVTLNGWVY